MSAPRTSTRQRCPAFLAPPQSPPRTSPRRSRRTHALGWLQDEEGHVDVMRMGLEGEDEDVLIEDVDRDGAESEREEEIKVPPRRRMDSPPRPKSKSIKLVMEEREDLQLLPKGYERQHRYGGRLTDDQADISLTTPLVKDRRRFQAAQHEAH